MDNVKHLWNITQFLVKNNNAQVNELRNHYVRCCKELSDEVELPKQIFGPNTMCSYCGSLWSSVGSKVRICKGRGLSKSIQKLVRISHRNTSSLSKYKKNLMERCVQKQANKLIITCCCCKRRNEILLNKPKRQKLRNIEGTEISRRKKKKRYKDKTAGLIINTPINLNDFRNNEGKNNNNHQHNNINNSINNNNSTNKKHILNMKKGKRRKTVTSTPITKSKKINILKLKGMIITSTTPSKKSNLHSFLSELT